MANTLRFKRGLVSGIPTAALGEPLFTTDTFDLYIGNGTTNTRFQKYIASGTTSQLLRGDGSLLTMPIVLTSPSNGQVLKYNGTSWVNDSDAGITGSGAAGQVAFFTGATTQSGSNNLFWDSSVSRLGVGTNNPAYRFHAISSDASIGAFRNSGAALGQLLVGNTAGDLGIRILASGDGLIFSDTSKYLAFGTNGGSERFRITSGGNFIINNPSTDNGLRFQVTGDGYFSGSVGIGTASPQSKLVVQNASGTAIPSLGSHGGHFQIQNGSYGLLSGVATSGNAWMQVQRTDGTATAYNLILQPTAGSVVIGSASSSSIPLYLNNASGNNTNLAFQQNSTDKWYIRNITGTDDFSFYSVVGAAERMRLTSGGNLGLGVTPSAWGSLANAFDIGTGGSLSYNFSETNLANNVYRINTGASLYKYTGIAMMYSQSTSGHLFYTAPSGTAGTAITFTQAMTLDASGNLFLGTTSYGTYSDRSIALYSTTNPSIKLINATTGTLNTDGFEIILSGSDGYVWNRENANIIFGTNNAERARIFSDGNVGIGTGSTNAGFRLDVNGTMRVSGASTVRAANIQNTSDNYLVVTTTNASGDAFTVYENSGDANNAWAVGRNNAGNFVINHSTAATIPNGTYSNRLLIDSTGAATFSSSVTATQAILNTPSGAEAIIIKGRSSDDASQISINTNSNSSLAYIFTTTSEFRLFANTNLSQTFWAGGIERGRITSGGNWLLGTTTDSGERLVVSGTMKVTSDFTVTGSSNSSWIGAIDNQGTTNANGLYVNIGASSTGKPFAVYKNFIQLFGVENSGAATFSSSVTATENYQSNSYTNTVSVGTTLAGNKTYNYIGYSGYWGIKTTSTDFNFSLDVYNSGTPINALTINQIGGAATFGSSIQAATAIAIGTTPDTNKPFKVLKNINGTVGINFENTSTGASAFSAIQMGTDVTGGTKFTNLVYASSGVAASGVYNPDGTSLINNGAGGLNFLGNPIRMYTGGSNGSLRWDMTNDGFITQYTGTNPSTNATDGYRQYSADVVAGNAAPHFRTENGAIIKLYQETTAVGNSTISVGGGNAVLDDTEFDGYTLRQIVKALRNQGILQ